MEKANFCPVCQRKNKPDSSRCVYCGSSLNLSEANIRTTLNIPPSLDLLEIEETCQEYIQQMAPGDIAIIVQERHDPIILSNITEVTIGRFFEEDNDACIDLDPLGAAAYGVSRRHAQIVRIDDKYIFEDLKSTNGSWINGQRLPAGTSYPLMNGDQIWLGQFKMRICFYQAKMTAKNILILKDETSGVAKLTPDILLEKVAPFLQSLNTLQKIAARCLQEGEETLTIEQIDADSKAACYIIYLSHQSQATHLFKKWIMPWRTKQESSPEVENQDQQAVQLSAQIINDIAPNLSYEEKFSLTEELKPAVKDLGLSPISLTFEAL